LPEDEEVDVNKLNEEAVKEAAKRGVPVYKYYCCYYYDLLNYII
jgi:hypothetical protein